MTLSQALKEQEQARHRGAAPTQTAWGQVFDQARDALDFVAHGRALLVEHAAWRVERGPGTDITITIRQVARPL